MAIIMTQNDHVRKVRDLTQGSAKGRVFPGRVEPARVSGFRAGFRVALRVPGPGENPEIKFDLIMFSYILI